jgi:hypothetical protein
VKWFRLSATHGFAKAQYNLGVMYRDGQGVAQDYKEAVRWFQLSAAQGHVSAQFNLGEMYDKGWGVTRDYVRAHMWWNLAASQGDADAATNRELVAKDMTPQQVARAKEMAQRCQSSKYKQCD